LTEVLPVLPLHIVCDKSLESLAKRGGNAAIVTALRREVSTTACVEPYGQ
jgi:hypothetical protein